MPTLDWIGKKAVLSHHRQVPYRLLHDNPELSVGDPDSSNLLIQGDNLLALKALLPYYVGKVKCIYIHPPQPSCPPPFDKIRQLRLFRFFSPTILDPKTA